jgi:DNA-binding Lrp family transcriptional regulator
MEEALILVVLSPSFDYDSLPKVQKIPGVQEANLIYGAYDMYVTLKTESMKEIRSAVLAIREMPGVQSTLTCNVINE